MAKTEAKGTTKTGFVGTMSTTEKDLFRLIERLRAADISNSHSEAMQLQATKDIKNLRNALVQGASKEERRALEESWGEDNFHDILHRTYRTYVSMEAAVYVSGVRTVPGDRKFSKGRETALRRSMRLCLLPFRWAVAVVRDELGNVMAVYRLDGNHSSTLLRDNYELLKRVPELLLTVFECTSMEQVRRAYQSFNLKQSARSLKDLIVVEYHGIPRLSTITAAPALLQSLVSGLAFDRYGLKWDKVLPQDKLPLISRNSDFIEWAIDSFKGFTYGTKKGGVKKFMSAPVLAAVYRAWCLSPNRDSLKDIFRRMLSAGPPSVRDGVVVMQSEVVINKSDAPEVQCSHLIQTHSLNASRCIDKINEQISYDVLYKITSRSLDMAMHNRKGDVTTVSTLPWSFPE